MKRAVLLVLAAASCAVAVVVYTGRARPAPVAGRASPPATPRRAAVAPRRLAAVPGPAAVGVVRTAGVARAAAAVRAFAQAWWSYDWRTGWPAAARAAATWETPALAAMAGSPSSAPAWDAGRASAREVD